MDFPKTRQIETHQQVDRARLSRQVCHQVWCQAFRQSLTHPANILQATGSLDTRHHPYHNHGLCPLCPTKTPWCDDFEAQSMFYSASQPHPRCQTMCQVKDEVNEFGPSMFDGGIKTRITSASKTNKVALPK